MGTYLKTPLLFLLSICLFACQQKVETLSKEEALVVAQKIDSSIEAKLPKYLNELFDEKELVKKIAKRLHISTPGNKEMAEMKETLRKASFGDKIIQAVNKNGHYHLVKCYEKDKRQHLLFRLYTDGGFNYHDFELVKRDGKAGIADVYIYLTGEDLSETVAGVMKSYNSLSKDNKAEARNYQVAMQKMRELVMKEDFTKAESYYQTLPASIKNERTVRIMYLQVCQGLGNEQYLAALNDFKEKFPNDPNLNLLMIDGYIISKEYDKAIHAVNMLDSFINKDGYLDYYRALLYKQDDQQETALRLLENACKSYPGYQEVTLELIDSYIEEGMNEKARALVATYRKNKQFDQNSLELYLAMRPGFNYTDQ